ncbi:TetR/AcrR family transcriptional regulator [Phenylobacterium montanum]|uniref:TetR/AcrR family transcriptional regulator n=1 Tax=Phenylobacterium montanum TaxID=2823693 RepID=A0A975FW84_9CAUL|nr:TetR/AcrR family transcriptional regulator [Caulobacter sp. S6]QUD86419.1 TetR/AcrR family transcriptional regulator [Caulobacter sp. S6]
MTTVALAESKPYHHGDLRRALLLAAEAVLEREGPSALSLRAVAREAGVSPAAPYHHFKDKNELLNAVAMEGFSQLHDAMAMAIKDEPAEERRLAIGVAYVEFAQANPALYRVMYDCARNGEALPEDTHENDAMGGYKLVKDTINEASGGQLSELDLELTCIASWCAVHGLAEMCKFHKFNPLKEMMGGERAFLEGVLDHFGVLSRTKKA